MNKELYSCAEDFVKVMQGYEWSYEGVDDLLSNYIPAQYKIGYGATRVAIIPRCSPYVLKFNFDSVWCSDKGDGEPSMDYNATEIEIYNRAMDKGLDCLFAKVEAGGFVDGIPCVLQERVDNIGGIGTGVSLKAWKTLNKHKISSDSYEDLGMSMELAGEIVENYGEDVYYEFCRFCEDNRINDIHNQNWGYIDGAPVVLDYAGYHENSYSSDSDSYYSADVGSGDGSWNDYGWSSPYSGSGGFSSTEK
jgi:hypothetical protein